MRKVGPCHHREIRVKYDMITSSNGNGFLVTGSVTGVFPTQSVSNAGFGVFFDDNINKRLNKQSTRRWFETPYDVIVMSFVAGVGVCGGGGVWGWGCWGYPTILVTSQTLNTVFVTGLKLENYYFFTFTFSRPEVRKLLLFYFFIFSRPEVWKLFRIYVFTFSRPEVGKLFRTFSFFLNLKLENYSIFRWRSARLQ